MVALGASTCCQLKFFIFLFYQLQHTVDNEVSVLARLALNENSLIAGARNRCPLSALTGVRIKRGSTVFTFSYK